MDCALLANADKSFWVNPRYAAILQKTGITDAAALWNYAGETVKKLLSVRYTERALFSADNGQATPFYIKRYRPVSLREHLKCLFSLKFKQFNAFDEGFSMCAAAEKGFPVPAVIAMGKLPDGRTVIAIEGLNDCVESRRLLQDAATSPAARREIITLTANLAADFHNAGFAHQDLYFYHFFITRAAPCKLYMIDLQRVLRHPHLPERWFVKDIGQLIFDMRLLGCKIPEITRMWRIYRQKRGFSREKARIFFRRAFVKSSHILARELHKIPG